MRVVAGSLTREGCCWLLMAEARKEVVPTVFRWEHGGNDVYITGTFNNWAEKAPMHRSGNDFTYIHELRRVRARCGRVGAAVRSLFGTHGCCGCHTTPVARALAPWRQGVRAPPRVAVPRRLCGASAAPLRR